MPDQTQPELAVGQVWRSPSGNRTREIVNIRVVHGDVLHIGFRTAGGIYNAGHDGWFRHGIKGWTLDAPAEGD